MKREVRVPETLLKRLGLNCFTALDLETTGLEDTCEIIEVGLVRYEAGQVRSRLSSLVKPSLAVPPRILQLTGIDPRKLKKAPALLEILPEVLELIGQDPLVAHNLAFDEGVLQRSAGRLGSGWRPAVPGIDTVPLARVLLPTLGSHRLIEVATHLEILHENAHRALDDAEAAGGILLKLMEIGAGLDLHLLRRLALLSRDTGDVQERIFGGLLDWVKEHGAAGDWRALQPPSRESVYRREGGAGQSRSFATAEWFGAKGRLQQSVEGFRHRPQQEEMAAALGRLLESHDEAEGPRVLVAEAATGTGKSFAYLLPAMLAGAARRDAGGGPVVVSTHTRNLQDQLFDKDIPRLGQLLDTPFSATLLKGRGNYLCGRRLERLLDDAPERLSAEDRLALMPLITWAALTRSGDVEESTGFRAVHLSRLWSLVRSDGPACANPGCRSSAHREDGGPRCWGSRARMAAQASHLVVVNHSLLLSDLGVDHGVLGPFDTLIVDEAHQFGRSADQHLRRSFSFHHLEGRLRALHDPQAQGRGLLKQLRARLLALDLEERRRDTGLVALEAAAEAGDMALEPATQARAELLEVQRDRFGASIQRTRYTQKERLRGECQPLRLLAGTCRQLEESLTTLNRSLQTLLNTLEEVHGPAASGSGSPDEMWAGLVAEVRGQATALLEDTEVFSLLLEEDDQDGEVVTWAEVHPGHLDTTFVRLNLDPGGKLAEDLWGPLKRVALTSATLTVGGSFGWLLQKLGLDRLPRAPETVVFESPFELVRQARFFVPTWFPESSGMAAESFARDLADLVVQCCERYNRGTLLLFTSYTLLNRCHLALLQGLDQKRFPLLAQGLDGSRTELLERFRREGNAVLLGTDSFWEGVDVPGEALQILVMTKLPFEVPGEPLLDARAERIQARGGNPFMESAVPEAVIRFRQGFGRLIRHESDKGVFLLLDSRVVKKEYGRVFLQSVPLPHRMSLREEDLHRELKSFWS